MDVPRAQVSEKDGEVSCSIEETNRIRALLGLRPLDVGVPTKTNEVVVPRAAAKLADSPDNEHAVRDRIEQARRDREQIAAKSLGQDLKQQQLSAADWVNLSRKQDLVHKAKLELQQRQNAGTAGTKRPRQEDYSSKDLAGLRIRHDVDAIAEGSDGVVLTLADRGVLEHEGQGRMRLADDGEDELINVELSEREKAAEAVNRRKNIKKPMYSGLEEEDADSSSAPTGIGRPRAILAQYDEDIDGKPLDKSKTGAKLVIAADGSVTDASGAEAVRLRLAAAAAKKAKAAASFDLRDGPTVPLSSAAAGGSGHSAHTAATASKKKSTLRRPGAASDDEDEGQGESESSTAKSSERLVAELQRLKEAEGGSAGGGQDRGSRARRGQVSSVSAKLAAEEASVAAATAAAYAQAHSRAQAKAASAMGLASGPPAGGAASESVGGDSQASSAAHKPLVLPLALPSLAGEAGKAGATGQRVYARLRQGVAEDDDAEDGDTELQSVLAKSRRLALERMQQEQRVAAAARPLPHPAQDVPRQQEADTAPQGMTFNSLTEFSRLLQARVMERVAEEQQESSGGHASTSVSAPGAPGRENRAQVTKAGPLPHAAPAPEEDDGEDMDLSGDEGAVAPARPAWQGGTAVGGDEEGEEEMDEEEEGSSQASDNYGESFTASDPTRGAGTSVAAAFNLFKSVGALQSKELFAGRANDKRLDPSEDGAGQGSGVDVRLEYKDEFGRHLTPKEAYRQLSYKFHGRAPSKSSRDKRYKKMLREQSLASGGVGVGTTSAVAGLQRVQEVTGNAFVTLSKR